MNLPQDYGVDDVPLIFQDKRFGDDDDFITEPSSFFDILSHDGLFGILGDTSLVNGICNSHFTVARSLTRLRILNGSNARFYNLGFDDDRIFNMIAPDNGFVPGDPATVNRYLIGPGERVEIVVEFAPGDDVILRSYAQDLSAGRVNESLIGAGDTLDLLRLRAATDLWASLPLEHPGAVNLAPEIPLGATERQFTLDGHESINGREMQMSRIDEVVPAGAVEIWTVKSNGQPHTFHIHGCTFQVIAVDGEEPPAHLRGPKDTVLIAPAHPVRLAVQFDDKIDPEFPYMFHCHILRHEANGMMGQFVVEPGTKAATLRVLHTRHHSHE